MGAQHGLCLNTNCSRLRENGSEWCYSHARESDLVTLRARIASLEAELAADREAVRAYVDAIGIAAVSLDNDIARDALNRRIATWGKP